MRGAPIRTSTVRPGVLIALLGLVLGGLIATPAVGQSSGPQVTLHRPDGNHADAVRPNQRVTFEGSLDPAADLQLHYELLGSGGGLLCAKDITGAATRSGGSFDGSYVTNHRCNEAFVTASEVRLRVTAKTGGTTRSAPSNHLRVDAAVPDIDSYLLQSTTEIVVTFTEPVWHVNNDTGNEVEGNPSDWRVDPGTAPGETCCSAQAQTPVSVGVGDDRSIRTLTLGTPLDADATPRVVYRNPDQPTTGALTVYEDAVQSLLHTDGRDQTALDRVLPAEPGIDMIAGDDTTDDGEARGSDATPDVHVTNVREGHTVEIRLNGPQGQRLASGTVPDGESEITLTTSDLGDGGDFTLVARAIDPHGNARSEQDPPTYHLDLSVPEALRADPDDIRVVVRFSEPIDGSDAASQWDLSGSNDIRGVQAVDGFSDRRVLRAAEDVAPGTILTWTPPSNGAYHDDVGNEVVAFELEIGPGDPPPPPSIDTVNGDDASDGTTGNDASPVAHVTDIEEGHVAEVHLSSGDQVGEEEAGADGADVQLDDLGGDGTYFLRATAVDGQGNPTPAEQEVAYRLDTAPPEPIAAVADGRDLTLLFSEAVDGTDAPHHWSIAGCLSLTCPEVLAVSGDGNERTLTTSEPAREGWLVQYSATGDDRYRDAAGNAVEGFPVSISGELPPLLSLSGPASVAEGDSGTTGVTYTVSLSAASEKPVAVFWETQQASALGGEDYESNSGLVPFLPGQTEQDITVDVIGDMKDESDETFSVALTQSLGEPISPDGGIAETTIVDDDGPPALNVGDRTVEERNGGRTPVAVVVTKAGATDRPVRASWRTVAGSATPGEDFVMGDGTIELAPGETEKTVFVDVIGDIVGEEDETFDVVLSSPQNATLGDATATVTIVNDDPPSIRAGDARVDEPTDGARRVLVPVTMSPEWDREIRVEWETVAGSATAGLDFRTASGAVTIPPGRTSTAIPVEILADDEPESTESFTVELTDVNEGRILDAVAEVSIFDASTVTQSVDTQACPVGKVPPSGFEDISGSVHAGNIACVAWYGITVGVGDTDGDGAREYRPVDRVTRAQMASFIARLAREAGVGLPASPPDAFDDDAGSVHEVAINRLAAVGIVTGRDDVDDVDGDGDRQERVYAPSEFVSRAQMASFIARVADEAGASLPESPPDAFDDDTASVHHTAINRIAAAGIVVGRQDRTDADRDGDTSEFHYFPTEFVSRAQMASFLANELGLFASSGIAYAGGAQVALDETRVQPGGTVRGTIQSHKTLGAVHVTGCGVDEDLTVGSDARFAFTVPEDQDEGECGLAFRITTRRDTGEQTVTHDRTIAVVSE